MDAEFAATQARQSEMTDATEAVKVILRWIGENPDREGLKDTPGRVIRALTEMTEGKFENPERILSRTFDEPCDEMVLVTSIPFTSLCEHHLLPFVGTATVGYIPNGKVVGLSKIPRLVECFAKRLQIQERMTDQIAQAIEAHLDPLGVGVVVSAAHSCMTCRGVRKSGAGMVTSSMLGLMKSDSKARSEFLSMAR